MLVKCLSIEYNEYVTKLQYFVSIDFLLKYLKIIKKNYKWYKQ